MSIGCSDTLDINANINQNGAIGDINNNNNNNSHIDCLSSSAASSSLPQQPSEQQQQTNSTISIHDTGNRNYISNSTQNSNSRSTSTPKATAFNCENLKSETLDEKKRKLTLPLGLGSSPASELSSISSSDSSSVLVHAINANQDNNSNNEASLNKRQKTYIFPISLNMTDQHQSNHTTSNKDLVNHLDQNITLTTPQLDRLLTEFNATSSSMMKTPGSALALLTPSTAISSNINFFNTINFTSPNEENSFNIVYANPSSTNNNNNNNDCSNISSYKRQTSELLYQDTNLTPSTLVNVNPNVIFSVNQNLNSNNNNNNNNNQSAKFTTLTNVQSYLNGSSINNGQINNLSRPSNNNNNNNNNNDNADTHNNTGNYLLIEPSQNNEANMVKLANDNDKCEYINTNMLNNSTNKILNTKDELQTVPVHPITLKQPNNDNKKETLKRKSSTSAACKTKTKANNNKSPNLSSSGSSIDSTIESLNSSNNLIQSSALVDRRDTGNSLASSSNLDSFSPINLDDQESRKLEKKRERNREAARKCRTRKLEKIALLEIQVKKLTDENEIERSKTETLREEINKIRQKLEMHKKLHNCDLKINI